MTFMLSSLFYMLHLSPCEAFFSVRADVDSSCGSVKELSSGEVIEFQAFVFCFVRHVQDGSELFSCGNDFPFGRFFCVRPSDDVARCEFVVVEPGVCCVVWGTKRRGWEGDGGEVVEEVGVQ